MELCYYLLKGLLLDRLREILIHSSFKTLHLIPLLLQGGARDNHHVRYLMFTNLLAKYPGRLEAIGNGHVAVHEDHLIPRAVTRLSGRAFPSSLDYLGYGLLPIERDVGGFRDSTHLQEKLECIYVKLVVIHDQHVCAGTLWGFRVSVERHLCIIGVYLDYSD